MFEITGNNIYITQGDTAKISVSILETNGAAHKMKAGDSVVLTVKTKVGGTSKFTASAASIAAGATQATITITSTQSAIDVGRYSADIQYKSGSEVYTIFPVFSTNGDKRVMKGEESSWNNFWVLPQITTT